jgi:hypothetical protein
VGNFIKDGLIRFKVARTSWGISAVTSSEYLYYVTKAAGDDNIFLNFKRSQIMMTVVELSGRGKGEAYLKNIKATGPKLLLDHLDDMRVNDRFGNPLIHDYGFSSATLRYTKVLGDLINHFGPLDRLDIVEIGAGYGGQCLLVSRLFKFKSFTIIDLEPSLKLQKKYLSMNKVENVRFLSASDPYNFPASDLLISNYAISEFDKKTQDLYLNEAVSKAKNFYIACNVGARGAYSKKELIEKLMAFGGTQVFPDMGTAPGNFIVLKKDKNDFTDDCHKIN